MLPESFRNAKLFQAGPSLMNYVSGGALVVRKTIVPQGSFKVRLRNPRERPTAFAGGLFEVVGSNARRTFPSRIKRSLCFLAIRSNARMPTLGDFETIIALNVSAKCDSAFRHFSIVDRTVLDGWRRLVLANRLVFGVTESAFWLVDWCVFRFVASPHVAIAAEIQIALTNTGSALLFSPRISGWILNRAFDLGGLLTILLSRLLVSFCFFY
jgi:hypothetical protein